MHAWVAAGKPIHQYTEDACSTVCATCAMQIIHGVPLSQIETPTTANHADYFRYGSKYVCSACAWLFGAGKGKPGNYIATPNCMEYAVISLDSVVENKRPWIVILKDIAAMPNDTPVAGVMTTDVKPRLWPKTRIATVGRFGLYIHSADYDVSEYREFDLSACVSLIDTMCEPLANGYAKTSLYHGLFRDYARTVRDTVAAIAWEAEILPHRNKPHFLPALIAAGVTMESKRNVTTARPDSHSQPIAARSDQAGKAQFGLF